MIGTSTTEIKCVKCKRVFETEVVDHIDLSQDQEFIKKLRAGKANRVQCPKCKKVMYLDRSIVINFEPQNLIVVYDTKASTSAKREEFQTDFDSVLAYNEALSEAGEDLEFQVISQADKLKPLLDEYLKLYG
ncbi:MAG: CpXC domain-containing protein [Candidatus Thorarchaeota archaeon]